MARLAAALIVLGGGAAPRLGEQNVDADEDPDEQRDDDEGALEADPIRRLQVLIASLETNPQPTSRRLTERICPVPRIKLLVAHDLTVGRSTRPCRGADDREVMCRPRRLAATARNSPQTSNTRFAPGIARRSPSPAQLIRPSPETTRRPRVDAQTSVAATTDGRR